jgi:hypothetical protein
MWPLVGAGVLILLALINSTLHNLNLEMALPLNKVLKGKNLESMNNKTAMNKHDDQDVEQLIYVAFSWEHAISKTIVCEHTNMLNSFSEEDEEALLDEYQEVQLFIARDKKSGKTFIEMKQGCETRWWMIGEAAHIIYKTLPIQKSMVKHFGKLKGSNSKAKEPCQTFLSLVKEPCIICNLALLTCHHRLYMATTTLQFFQHANMLTRKRGFGVLNVFV